MTDRQPNRRPRAGAAFMAAMRKDTKAQAALARAQSRLRAFAEAMKDPEFQRERARARQEQDDAFMALAEAIREAVLASGDRLAAEGFTPPETIEAWEHLARIVEMPFTTIQSGNFTARDVYVMALAWLDRQKLKMKLAERGETRTKAQKPVAYTVAALREMTGLGNTSLRQYAKSAGIKTPRRGQRNFRYSSADACLILRTIIDTASETAVRRRCQAALKALAEIAE
jgi:hypothetical protein